MKTMLYFWVCLSVMGLTNFAQASDVEFVSTGQGQVSGSDAVIADDPYAGRKVPESAFKGNSATQKPYGDECQDDMCQRAKQRQTSEGSDWRGDVKSGLHQGYGGGEQKPVTAPEAQPQAPQSQAP